MEQGRAVLASASRPTWETFETFAREQIQAFVQAFLEEEMTTVLGRTPSQRRAAVDAPAGHRNGYGKPRCLAMPSGTITVRRPRVRGVAGRVESRILPLFQRRTQAVGDLLPELSLHGLAQGDFELALRGLLGDGAPLSASSIARLRGTWSLEYDAWRSRRLDDRELGDVWADGVYVKAGLEQEKAAVLVVIGAMRDGRKEILAITPGYRESTASWAGVFRDLRDRGLRAPKLMVADGQAGTWAAAAVIWPTAPEQRCWNHTLVNGLDRLPKTVQAEARALLGEIPYAPTQREAERQRDACARRYRTRDPQAVACLEQDWDRMVAFYAFPEAHWKHLRTTNVVESPCAAVRLRTGAAKRFKTAPNATTLIWKVLQVAESRFRRLDAPERLAEVYAGRRFVDGTPAAEESERVAA
jgi:transposase-like protein